MAKPRNQFEKKINTQLKRSKLHYSYETERIPYVLAKHYIPDFIITTSTGILYVECKGYLRPEDKCKLIAVKRQHPNKDIRICFYSKSKANTRWAEKHGFRYSIEKIPRDWLEGF